MIKALGLGEIDDNRTLCQMKILQNEISFSF